MVEKTFVMIKPRTVQRGFCGQIINRFERRGFTIAALKKIQISPELAARHYAEHQGKPFYEDLTSFITSGPVVAMVLQGRNAVAVARSMIGSTDSGSAAPGTIRGDFSLSYQQNVIHGSDSISSAEREISLFFSPEEILA